MKECEITDCRPAEFVDARPLAARMGTVVLGLP